jgi:hypothetical protein
MSDENFDIQEFFPGHEFQDEIKQKNQSLLQDTVNKILDSSRGQLVSEYEQRVIQQYTKHGALSTFKGVKQIQEQKSMLDVQRRMDALMRSLDTMREHARGLDNELKELKVL